MGESLGGTQPNVEAFVKRWSTGAGGAERSNYVMFLTELCDLLGVKRPDPAGPDTEHNDYVFERSVKFRHHDGSTSPGRIDLYKKGCFVLEAKQSKKRREGGEVYDQLSFALDRGRGSMALLERPRTKRKGALGSASWDALMRSARKQAEDYARALDEWPPFLVVVDVGHVIELYADFSRQGKNYALFPDRNSFRISLAELHGGEIRERLRLVWDDPFSLDPSKHAAEVTQEIAALLAKMTQTMERRAPSQDIVQKAEWAFKVSKFLMRCIFAMFAEDIGLLPKGAFLKLIQQHKGNARHFHLTADQFFREMDKGAAFSPLIQAKVREFNGGLFRDTVSIELNEDELALLAIAAGKNWRNVEPAIFGTLLEQALSERERSKLGAHYTPRSYVERLVVPTVIEPLREDWDTAQSAAIGRLLENDEKGAREIVRKFHDRLCDTRVLDPACGTGNFLYVALELMKRLEGEVLDFLKELGEGTDPLRTVDPHQFLGLEANPRAVPIAELVLWIGYIQWWFRTRERQVIAEPILRDFRTIKIADAVLAYDKQELLRDEKGRPVTRQDPHATKLHPITGEPVPDPDARLEVYRYTNPRPAQWPETEFIVGNPPFIGGKDLREERGEDYTRALWASRNEKSDSRDYVMYWWDHAASILVRSGSRLRRFGFITTNKITQKFSRRIVEEWLEREKPISLLFAIPDHPWQKGSGKALVRIAMTVASRGGSVGRLSKVVGEEGLNTENPRITLVTRKGRINPDITIGADVTKTTALKANQGLSSPGVKLHGDGFILLPNEARNFGLGRAQELDKVIKPYLHNRDLKSRPRGVFVIDLFGLNEHEVRQRYPALWQRLHDTVRVQRQEIAAKTSTNDAKDYAKHWWLFGKPRDELRPALAGLHRIIATGETSKHRFFEFFSPNTLADNMVRLFATDDAFHLGVLSSRIHVVYSLRRGGWIGAGNDPRYQAECFSTFPFPDANDDLKDRVRSLAEELDALRKRVLSEHGFLTMTKLYNVREKLRSSESLDEGDLVIRDVGCVGVISELHGRIDAAVAEAYDWSPAMSEEEILARLIALNKERVEGERRGHVKWLRPNYQIPRFGEREETKEEQIEAELEAPEVGIPALPNDDADLVSALRGAMQAIGRPAEPKDIASKFKDGFRAARRVERGLKLLAAAGVVRRTGTGWFLPSDVNP